MSSPPDHHPLFLNPFAPQQFVVNFVKLCTHRIASAFYSFFLAEMNIPLHCLVR
jgi:hypothetical protein